MRPPSPDLLPQTSDRTDRAKRNGLALAVTLLGTTGLANSGSACPVILPDDSAAVSIELAPGVDQDFTVDVYEMRNEDGDVVERSCYANVTMSLAAFPSNSSRLDTSAVARTIQESAAALGVETCEVTVLYDDPKQELARSQRCVDATFGFSDNDFWTTESEQPCFSEEEFAQFDEWEREWEREQAAAADAYAAAEDGVEDVADGTEEEWGEALDDEAARAASDEVVESEPTETAAADDLA